MRADVIGAITAGLVHLGDRLPRLAPAGRHALGGLRVLKQEAQQLAAFINSKPRPVFPFKERDYRTEKLPPDAVYYPRP